jgi:hypothetical protein
MWRKRQWRVACTLSHYTTAFDRPLRMLCLCMNVFHTEMLKGRTYLDASLVTVVGAEGLITVRRFGDRC